MGVYLLNTNLITIGAILISIIAASVLILGGSQNSVYIASWPLFGLCGVLIFAIQWISFIPSYIYKTEKHFDLVGSLTYIAMAIFVLVNVNTDDVRSWIIALAVIIWAIRLGTFLFKRILSTGTDTRFDDIKINFLKLLMTWTLQGLWIFATFGAGLAAITSNEESTLGFVDFIGLSLFVIGLTIEIVADTQKSNFKKNGTAGFINIGLWKYSRHPNYLGEILIWVGISILSITVLSGWQYITLISPGFVILLLTKISGIPMLEKKSDMKWGHLKEYQNYKSQTPVLIPNMFNVFSRN